MNLTDFKIKWNNPNPVYFKGLFDQVQELQKLGNQAKIDISDLKFLCDNMFIHFSPEMIDKAVKQYKAIQKAFNYSPDQMKKHFKYAHRVVWTAAFQAQEFKDQIKQHKETVNNFCYNPTSSMYRNYVGSKYNADTQCFETLFEISCVEDVMDQIQDILVSYSQHQQNPQKYIKDMMKVAKEVLGQNPTYAKVNISPKTFEVAKWGQDFIKKPKIKAR